METLSQKDERLVWHPFTQMKTAGPALPVLKAQGASIFLESGEEIIDAVSSWWVNIHGHSHPYIKEKLMEQYDQMDQIIFAGLTHPKAVELAERITDAFPGNMEKVFFSDDGSTAIEVGIKMALQFWYNQGIEKKKIIAFERSYHGDTFGSMSVSGRSPFNNAFNDHLFDVIHVPEPLPGKEEEVLSLFESHLRNEDVAAFIYEPLVLGSGGMLMYTPEVLDKMMDLCDHYGALKIADEVMTGFGRTGKMFASSYCKNTPDITALSKGLTGGVMAMSLTLCTGRIYEVFHSDDKLKTFFHGHSFTANSLACAVACASLDLFEKQALESMERIHQKHLEFLDELNDFDLVENARVRGTIFALDVKNDEATNYFNNIRDRLYQAFLKKGLLLRPLGNIIYVLPPYCISNEQLDYIYKTIIETIKEIKQG